jgi:extracellular factor (EF) 3-hydroxypalmitic acid methyl ester biosynthesis protein
MDTGFLLLDKTQSLLLAGDVKTGMAELILGLAALKKSCTSEDWQTFSQSQFLQHSLVQLIHQDPFTYHSFVKPKGYAGDAVLLDFIYGYQNSAHITPLGQEIFNYTVNSTASISVRNRRKILAYTIDKVALNTKFTRILSIACGHLREAHLSKAIQEKQIEELIALDQDQQSLEHIKTEFDIYPITTVQSSVRSLITQKLTFDNLDFVYAAGLYDYLSQPIAMRLTRIMFEMLRSEGRLLVANFVPTLIDIGYMETFMQWFLIYRTIEEINSLADEIVPAQIAQKKTFYDPEGNIVFLELIRG